MASLDIAVAVILIASAIFAFTKGFVTEVLSLAAWGGAAVLTAIFYRPLGGWVDGFLNVPWLSNAVAIAFLFFFTLALLRLITNKIGGWVRQSNIGVLDRGAGAAFGVLRGFAMLSFAFLIYTALVKPDAAPVWIAEAKSGPAIMKGADVLGNLIYGDEGAQSPGELLKRLESTADGIAEGAAARGIGYDEDARQTLEDLTEAARGNK